MDEPPKRRDRRDRRPKLVSASVAEASASYPLHAEKRGRKPKGGKLVSIIRDSPADDEPFPNIILHLKCSLADIIDEFIDDPHTYNPEPPPVIQSYNDVHTPYFELEGDVAPATAAAAAPTTTGLSVLDTGVDNTATMSRINAKLEELKNELYKNRSPTQKSACFWCTYEFDSPEVYIPKYDICGEIYGYGSFCSPECAAAHLMRERVDDSMKFERYQLLNHLYGAALGYTHNIKPSPDPHYTLSKFCGKLTIGEYRNISRMNRLLLTVAPPITRALPELHDETDTHILQSLGYGSMSGEPPRGGKNFHVKRATDSQKTQSSTRTGIIKANFGF